MLEHLGTYLLQREEVVDALSSYREAIDVASGSVLNLARLGNIYHGLASGCLRIGESRKALEYFERAVAFSRSAHDVRGVVTANLARLENDYGDLLMRHGRWERAEEMIRAAIDHFDAIGVETNRAYALLSMATLHHRQGKLAEAFLWVGQAIELADRLGEPLSLSLGYQRLGELWADQGEEDRVEASFTRALEILNGADMPEHRAEALARYHQARSGRREQQQAN
jgi:tetratricopeptide (TPR) repeat protein